MKSGNQESDALEVLVCLLAKTKSSHLYTLLVRDADLVQPERAGFLVQAEYHGLGDDDPERYPAPVDSLTKEDVLRVAERDLHPARRIRVIVGDLEASGGGSPRR